MANGDTNRDINGKVFDMMETAAADKLFVDRALLPKPEFKIQLPEEKSEKSFEDFMETIGKNGLIIVNGGCSHGIFFTIENNKICMSGNR